VLSGAGMSDWEFTFRMEAGRTYRIRYVYDDSSTVVEAVFTFSGEFESFGGHGNIPIIVMDRDDKSTMPGLMQILSIDETAAEAEIGTGEDYRVAQGDDESEVRGY
jgi:hypothetical protein